MDLIEYKHNPHLLRLKKRYRLNKPGSGKRTYHLVLDLEGGSFDYEVGDCVGIYPENDPKKVEAVLSSVGADGEEQVVDPRSGRPWRFREFLSKRANLDRGSGKLLETLAQKGRGEQRLFEHLLENKLSFSPQQLSELFLPLLPRYYSIASSQCSFSREVHLTIALLSYRSGERVVKGVASHFLCSLAEEGGCEIPVYLHPHRGFTLPEDPHKPIIMIGPGTGVAPYRAFMQRRVNSGAKGRNWLFFGEWNRAYDFYYEEEWSRWAREGSLKIDLAFSRDQKEKVYVQHKMLERAEELYAWLEEGAFVYVCGDAKRMAKDVEAALCAIVARQRGEEEAKEYLKGMRREGRYLRDVY